MTLSTGQVIFFGRSFLFCNLLTPWDVMRRETKESSFYNNTDDSNKLHDLPLNYCYNNCSRAVGTERIQMISVFEYCSLNCLQRKYLWQTGYFLSPL